MNMTSGMKFLIIGGAGVLLMALALFFSMTSWYDTANSLENATRAQWMSNQNTYDSFWKTVKEVAQVPDKYKEDFKGLLVAETQAKFGPGGSKATFQWFQDRQINFDAGQYRKIQDVIESGRADFKRSQDELLDKQRKVRDVTSSYFGGMFAKHYNFPRTLAGAAAPPKDLDGDGKLTVLDYPIVTSAQTQAAFQTGEADAVNVFGK
jgi:hypothetical protein